MAERDMPIVRLTAPLQEDGVVVEAVEVIFDSSEEEDCCSNIDLI